MVRNLMQKISKKKFSYWLVAILVVVLCVGIVCNVSQPVFANDGSVETTFFGNIKDEGDGCGVYLVLNFVIDVLAFGVGIAAIIGITISGIMYLTARDNQTQTLKAKRRIYEIVLGLALYLVLWSFLSFLLPGGVLNNTPTCGQGTDSEGFFTTPDPGPVVDTEWSHYGRTRRLVSGDGGTTYTSEVTEGTGNLLTAARTVAEIYVKKHYSYGAPTVNKYSQAKAKMRGKSNCASYVSLVAQAAGLLKDGQIFYTTPKEVKNKGILKKFDIVDAGGATVASLVRRKALVPGDIVGTKSHMHTMIYAGKINGKYYYFNGGRNATNTGKPGGKYVDTKKFLQTYSAGGGKGSLTIKWIIHPKG